ARLEPFGVQPHPPAARLGQVARRGHRQPGAAPVHLQPRRARRPRLLMKPILLTILSLVAAPAHAALNVFACEPEWGALARELGGDKVSIYSATTALQDPHRIEARPSLIARIRSADLLICSGSELEIGWIPLLLTQSGNPSLKLGSPGYFEASQYVVRLEVPKVIDRALGDLHPGGNLHVHTDPRNIARIAPALMERMSELDPANADSYRSRGKSFLARWQRAIARREPQARRREGVRGGGDRQACPE